MRTTAMRCGPTSAESKLSQKPLGPRGQFSGSERKNRKTARPRNISGHILAHAKYLLRERSARIPITKTTTPAHAWLYSDHAISSGVSFPKPDAPGTKEEGTLRPAALARRRSSFADFATTFTGGLVNWGMRGE